MKIAVLSDIHANILALESIIKDMKDQCVDDVVFLGDLVMTGPRPSETFDLLESLKPVVWIKGNTDDWLSEIDDSFVPQNTSEEVIKTMSQWAEQKLSSDKIRDLLSKNISFEFHKDNSSITFCHGSPTSYSQAIYPEIDDKEIQTITSILKSNILVCGHTHLRFNMNVEGKTIINFGAVSIPGNDFSKDARYGIIDINGKKITFTPRQCIYNTDKFLNDIQNLDFPGEQLIRKKFGFN